MIFIDRTVDICGVTTHSSNSVLDKLMTLLPRFPGHVTDVAVNMSLLCEADMYNILFIYLFVFFVIYFTNVFLLIKGLQSLMIYI